MPAPGTAAHEDNEKPVTGDAADKAKAAAVKAVGEGTAGEVTTDYFGNGYEVTVTKSDGSEVEIHLDSSFNAMGPQGGPGGAPPPVGSTTDRRQEAGPDTRRARCVSWLWSIRLRGGD
jgi:hypothetical protein